MGCLDLRFRGIGCRIRVIVFSVEAPEPLAGDGYEGNSFCKQTANAGRNRSVQNNSDDREALNNNNLRTTHQPMAASRNAAAGPAPLFLVLAVQHR
jgi:hypothetical protein